MRRGSDQLISIILERQQGLLEDTAHIGVSGIALEIGGSKFGELVLGDVLIVIRGSHGHGGVHVRQTLLNGSLALSLQILGEQIMIYSEHARHRKHK